MRTIAIIYYFNFKYRVYVFWGIYELGACFVVLFLYLIFQDIFFPNQNFFEKVYKSEINVWPNWLESPIFLLDISYFKKCVQFASVYWLLWQCQVH